MHSKRAPSTETVTVSLAKATDALVAYVDQVKENIGIVDDTSDENENENVARDAMAKGSFKSSKGGGSGWFGSAAESLSPTYLSLTLTLVAAGVVAAVLA